MIAVQEIKTSKVPQLGVILETKEVNGGNIVGSISVVLDEKGLFSKAEILKSIVEVPLGTTPDLEDLEGIIPLYKVREGQNLSGETEYSEGFDPNEDILSSIFNLQYSASADGVDGVKELSPEEMAAADASTEALLQEIAGDTLKFEMQAQGYSDEEDITAMRKIITELKKMASK